jgi:hypothetical protein
MTLYVAVFLVAAAYAVYTARRSGPLRMEMLVRAVLLLVTIAGVLLPALIGIVNLGSLTLARVVDPADPASLGDLLIATLVLAGLVLAARRWPPRLGETVFVVLALVLALGLKLAYVLAIRVPPVSDFADMWALTSTIAEGGLDAGRSTLSTFYYRWAYFERVLPYLLPLRLAFGPGPAVYSVANTLLGGLTSLLVYRMTRPWFGARAARVALVVSLVAVETVLAAEIPTHDIPGAFYTVLALALVLAVWRLQSQGRMRAALLVSAGLGLAVLVLDVQRATGGVLLLSSSLLGMGLALVEKRRLLPALALVLVPWMVFKSADQVLSREALRVPDAVSSNAQGIGLAAGTDSWGDGSFQHGVTNYTTPYNTLPVSWSSLALTKLATDTYYHPGGRVTSYLRKARDLFDLGSQTIFYLNAAELEGQGPVSEADAERVRGVSRWFSLLFLGALVAAAWRLGNGPAVPLPSLLPLFYLDVFILVLLLLAEVQPRYLYPIWYLGAVYVGALLGGSWKPDEPDIDPVQ